MGGSSDPWVYLGEAHTKHPFVTSEEIVLRVHVCIKRGHGRGEALAERARPARSLAVVDLGERHHPLLYLTVVGRDER